MRARRLRPSIWNAAAIRALGAASRASGIPMKIATFNVNGVNGRLPVLLRWLDEAEPDVVCLQELKAPQEKFPEAAIRDAGYGAIWHGQKSWNGVAILARGAEPIETRRGLPGDPDDVQSRYIEAAVDGLIVGCLYLPNGNPGAGPEVRLQAALVRALDRPRRRACSTSGAPVVLAGDYNVMPTERRRLQAGALARRRAVPARGARRLPPPRRRRAGPMRCARCIPDETHLHLLGLFPERLRPRCRPAHRPPAAQPVARRAPGRRRRRPRGARLGESQRPRADLDRARRADEDFSTQGVAKGRLTLVEEARLFRHDRAAGRSRQIRTPPGPMKSPR